MVISANLKSIWGMNISVRLTVENGVDPIGRGDVNGNGNVDLADAILALQVLCAVDTGNDEIYREADVNGESKIGLEEAIHALQVVSGIGSE